MTVQSREGPTIGAFSVAFSNDGTMVAAGNDQGILRLWNVETGELKTRFKGHTDAIKSLAFSPDDKTLLSGSTDRSARLWDVVTGQERLMLKGHKFALSRVAFAPDGRRLATVSGTEVKLWLAATEPEATALQTELDPDDPESPRAAINWGDRLQEIQRPREAESAYLKALVRLKQLAVSVPDTSMYQDELAYYLLASNLSAGRLAAAQADSRLADIWQTLPADRQLAFGLRLRRRGTRLRDAGRLPEAQSVFEQLTTLMPGDVEAWHRLGYTRELSGQAEMAIDAYKKALTIDPQHANIRNRLAWLLVTCSDAKLHDPGRAVSLAKEIVELMPQEGDYWKTLGAAYYRAGDSKAAIAALEKSTELRKGGDGSDWFFLAMAHWQHGENEKAREWYDRSVEWMEAKAKDNTELIRFRAEAEKLMK
jgi:tetratricopeptide (TPR) repeat protein